MLTAVGRLSCQTLGGLVPACTGHQRAYAHALLRLTPAGSAGALDWTARMSFESALGCVVMASHRTQDGTVCNQGEGSCRYVTDLARRRCSLEGRHQTWNIAHLADPPASSTVELSKATSGIVTVLPPPWGYKVRCIRLYCSNGWANNYTNVWRKKTSTDRLRSDEDCLR